MTLLRNHLDTHDMDMIISWSFIYFVFNVSFGFNPIVEILGKNLQPIFIKTIIIMLFLTFSMIMLDTFLLAWGRVNKNLKEKQIIPLQNYERYDPPLKDLREVVGKIKVRKTIETDDEIAKFVETANGVETYVKEK